METKQFNIRLSKELLKDLNIIEKMLKVNKSEWIKTKLAEEVHEEKNKLLMKVSTFYSKGLIDKNEVERLVGIDIAKEMEFIKNSVIGSARRGAEHGKLLRSKLKR